MSIIIKALNEQDNIAAAIESSLVAVAGVGGEVILADSCSTDRTVEVAAHYPVRIVQLAHPQERCCGVGPQLGYQHSRGEYVYILDGDMQMVPGFLERALAFLAQHPEVAGVGGTVVERNLDSLEYRERASRAARHLCPGMVDRLDGGALYRRRAIEEAGYFSDRNLHSYEEFDLATRLRARGWKLWRLPVDAATHYGHDAPPYSLLRRRWRSRYVCGVGELLRGSVSQPRLRLVWRDLRELRLYMAVLGLWIVMLTVPLWPLSWAARGAAWGTLLAGPLLLVTLRKKSLTRGLYSMCSWWVNTAGMVLGFVRPRRAACDPIICHVLKEPLLDGSLSGPPASGSGRGSGHVLPSFPRPSNNA